MYHHGLILPVLALASWTFVMWAWLYATRIPAVLKYKVVMTPHQPAAEFMATTDTAALLPSLAVPTLVVVGEHDTVTGVDESRLLADTIPGARFVLVPGAGHAAVTERPAEVAAAMLEFWEIS